MRRRLAWSSSGRRLLCGVAVALALGAPEGARAQQSVERINRELTAIEGRVDRLVSSPLRRQNLRSPTHVEERLTDGELFFRLQDYLRASIIFTDIVENYPTHTAYPDALFLLGESLFQAGDYLGARTRFTQVLQRANESPFRPYVQRSLGRIIEVAIHIQDFAGVEEHFQALSRLPPTEVEVTTAYFRAKYLYNRAVPTEEIMREASESDAPLPLVDAARLEEARQAFSAVPEGSPYYPQARYYIGVIHTLRSELPQAIEAFRRVLRAPAETTEQREVVELAHLALGRLYYETDQLDQAIEAYQTVPRTSSRFDVALYEIAWVFIRLGDATRAERALEVLSVAASESRFIPDAKVLRGNLLLRSGRLDDANEVFREVRREFGPVRRSLDDMANAHGDLGTYFRQLVRDNMDDFDANDFLPEAARRWSSFEGSDFERALSVLSDLATARTLIRETESLIQRLDGATSSANAVSVFADLRGQRETSTALRNRLARTRRAAIRLEEQAGGSESAELGDVRAQRRRIEQALGRMPTSDDDFIVRDDQLLNRYRHLEAELSDMRVELMGMEARIVATERFLEATREQRQGDTSATQAELDTQRAAVEVFRQQIVELGRLIEVGRLQVGVGDARYQRDDRLRAEYNRLVEREHQLGGRNAQTDAIFAKIVRLEGQLEQRDREIDAVVAERVADMRRVIEEERRNVAGYREALGSLEVETEEVVGGVTREQFEGVRHRFYDIVLRADVGRIDVAWARREEHRMRVELLTRERSREIQSLDDEFRDVMDERGPSAPAPGGEE